VAMPFRSIEARVLPTEIDVSFVLSPTNALGIEEANSFHVVPSRVGAFRRRGRWLSSGRRPARAAVAARREVIPHECLRPNVWPSSCVSTSS
jgi:hypothetical protein